MDEPEWQDGWQDGCTIDDEEEVYRRYNEGQLRFTDDGQWGADIFIGHAIGCNAVSWAPAVQPGSLITPQPADSLPGQPSASAQGIKRFASAGCDNLVKIWGYREDSQSWVEEEVLEGHTDWVRDVAWAPNIGLPRSYIATASQVRRNE
ncbi:hypothetical protein PHLCEN_2v5522 [Hermanssonia centrifuga]|uniref:Uncharacterized protein n=1 Tax=Hermanssonia centrifuga TaxID=98765 RepID=A0A2R6P2C0_9APHY|nr:hypothetical protein PHLCEN_2v5522 [Hermanssonia centrifuga]